MVSAMIPTVGLNDGHTIPQLGFGVFKIDPAETAAAVTSALEAGYRHIDTAEMYGNERGVGEAIRASDLDRSELYVTSKLDNGVHQPDDARRAFDGTLADLGTDYVDLFLIHWPLPTRYDGDYVSTWKVLEEFRADGRARSIGVSNFQVAHLAAILAEADVAPAVNQIELHPYLLNDAVRAYGEERGIVTEAWSPIAKGTVLDEPVVAEIAAAVERTPSQVVLRWHVQRGSVVFPEVDVSGADAREPRAVRLRTAGRRHGADLGARPRRGRADRPQSGYVRPALTDELPPPRRSMLERRSRDAHGQQGVQRFRGR
jgi:2,5-diketo-D-gluconate reductase A